MGLKDFVKDIFYRPVHNKRQYEVLQRYEHGAQLREEDKPFVGGLLSQNTGFHEDKKTGEIYETAHLSVDGRAELRFENLSRNRGLWFLIEFTHGM